nr:NADH dehydrogenase [ubiquinone] 1 beta subcomplex subunit 7-like [Ipomoea batatas]GMD13748.1 NADH dehydrogenase [ubiquinone] 1 beta subcomplex subunit 7-like [Ipomoea batatas]GMD19808.1 NADH dehydrogenase [ubiquinone] 1 beta subcomplex subunit 7-like [Ipomoea batatas]GMD20966.1 NADH dehydrogenase [ubiquinone] 1 beta subcomplex subunit 7-like [Ipomoea batatas]GMD71593.1 NADH dehydrogenase [ubiquinone] 1 beta subcomplex subunit 7-like [Ipomoea batatas]
MEVPGSSKKMIATQAEMVEAKCENERHSYEKCEYELVMERMLQMQKIRQQEAAHLKHGGAQQSIPLAPKTANA